MEEEKLTQILHMVNSFISVAYFSICLPSVGQALIFEQPCYLNITNAWLVKPCKILLYFTWHFFILVFIHFQACFTQNFTRQTNRRPINYHRKNLSWKKTIEWESWPVYPSPCSSCWSSSSFAWSKNHARKSIQVMIEQAKSRRTLGLVFIA